MIFFPIHQESLALPFSSVCVLSLCCISSPSSSTCLIPRKPFTLLFTPILVLCLCCSSSPSPGLCQVSHDLLTLVFFSISLSLYHCYDAFSSPSSLVPQSLSSGHCSSCTTYTPLVQVVSVSRRSVHTVSMTKNATASHLLPSKTYPGKRMRYRLSSIDINKTNESSILFGTFLTLLLFVSSTTSAQHDSTTNIPSY